MSGSGEPNETYLRLEAVYRAAFNVFLNKEGVLTRSDQELANSKLPYYPNKSKKEYIYQEYGSFGRQYVYLENDFYIEKLDDGDLDLLRHPTKDNLQAILDMVRRTYWDVIATPDTSYQTEAASGDSYGSSVEDEAPTAAVDLGIVWNFSSK